MNKSDRAKVLKTAKDIIGIYMSNKETLKNDLHTFHNTSQGLRDSLEAMKRNELILDYNLSTGDISEWGHPANRGNLAN